LSPVMSNVASAGHNVKRLIPRIPSDIISAMTRKKRTVGDLPWYHFLRRLYLFQKPDEMETSFQQRAGFSRQDKSRWLSQADPRLSTDKIYALADNLNLEPYERDWLNHGKSLEDLVPPPNREFEYHFGSYWVFGKEYFIDFIIRLYQDYSGLPERERLKSVDKEIRKTYDAIKASAQEKKNWHDHFEREPFPSYMQYKTYFLTRLFEIHDTTENVSELRNITWLIGILESIIVNGDTKADTKKDFAAEEITPDEPSPIPINYEYVPKMQGSLAAGEHGLVSDEIVEGLFAFQQEWLNHVAPHKDWRALVDVKGDSMTPTLIDGDMVLINAIQRDFEDGKIYAVATAEGTLIKEVHQLKNGKIQLKSHGKGYKAQTYNPDDVRIIGKCVWVGRELK
jgi:phage repressor protein C with HTH and peptisase S24 domain